MAQQKIKIAIPDGLTPAERLELADLVIEHIVERSDQGLDKKGNPFPKYSKGYIKSLDFKNAGKSDNVNLQLSGDMLAAIKLLKHSNGELVVGFEKGTKENDKAEGNILGTYGQPTPIRGKKRDFLGLESKKLRELIAAVTDGE